jgi:hypothetical protein
MEFLNVTDIGVAAKFTGLTFLPLADLRRVPGFEEAQYESPLAAGRYNRITRVAIAPWDLSLRVEGTENLFCAGEKLGTSGVAECLATGSLAGHNAVRWVLGHAPLVIPRTTGMGEFLAWMHERLAQPDGAKIAHTLGNGPLVEHMRQVGFYGCDPEPMFERVAAAGLTGVLARPLVVDVPALA